MKVISYVQYGEYVGEAFLAGKKGCVMAVHSQSIYFKMDDETLILCCSERYGRIPFALNLKDEGMEDLRSSIRFGMPVSFSDKKIRLGDAIVLYPEPVPDLHTEDEELLFRHFYPFLKACYDMDLGACTESLMKLIGLGKGLTPGADDLLTGFLYAFIRGHAELPFVSELCETVKHLAKLRTGWISQTYLNAVCSGKPFELLQDLYEALSTERNTILALTRLSVVGNSSGKEMAKGMLSWFILKEEASRQDNSDAFLSALFQFRGLSV